MNARKTNLNKADEVFPVTLRVFRFSTRHTAKIIFHFGLITAALKINMNGKWKTFVSLNKFSILFCFHHTADWKQRWCFHAQIVGCGVVGVNDGIIGG